MSFKDEMIAGVQELLVKWGVVGSDCEILGDLNDDTQKLYDVEELEERLRDE